MNEQINVPKFILQKALMHLTIHDNVLCETLRHSKTYNFFHKQGNCSPQIEHVLTPHVQTLPSCSCLDGGTPGIGKIHQEGNES